GAVPPEPGPRAHLAGGGLRRDEPGRDARQARPGTPRRGRALAGALVPRTPDQVHRAPIGVGAGSLLHHRGTEDTEVHRDNNQLLVCSVYLRVLRASVGNPCFRLTYLPAPDPNTTRVKPERVRNVRRWYGGSGHSVATY